MEEGEESESEHEAGQEEESKEDDGAEGEECGTVACTLREGLIGDYQSIIFM